MRKGFTRDENTETLIEAQCRGIRGRGFCGEVVDLQAADALRCKHGRAGIANGEGGSCAECHWSVGDGVRGAVSDIEVAREAESTCELGAKVYFAGRDAEGGSLTVAGK